MREMFIFFLMATLSSIVAIILSRLIMKRSVAFTNALAMTFIAFIIALMAFFVAIKGLIHLTWAAPIAIICILVITRYFSVTVSKPLINLKNTIDQLSTGDLSVEFYQAIRKKKNELGDIANSLTNMLVNLKQSVNVANMVSKGYLGMDLKDLNSDGDLDIALRNMVEKLREITENMSQAAEFVASSSKQISSSAQMVAQGANEQASATEEASSSLEEMSASVSQNSDNATETNQITSVISGKIKVLVDSFNETNIALKAIVEKIGIINDIADKTDLLAINAAIEAARAGEHGKGFAVVAGEVRMLAENSLKSASEIENMSNMSLTKAEKSNQLLNELVPEILKASNLVQEVAAASHEQTSGINQVNAALQQLNQVTQQNSALSEELSSSSEELAKQADHLVESISYFKTSKEDLEKFNIIEIEDQIKKLQDILSRQKSNQKETEEKLSILKKTSNKTESKKPKKKKALIQEETDSKITDEAFEKY